MQSIVPNGALGFNAQDRALDSYTRLAASGIAH
jgi:hypothetical protein